MAIVQTFDDLLTGASISQLGKLFDLDRRTVTERLRGETPCGKRANHPIYKVSVVAPLLVDNYLPDETKNEIQKKKNAAVDKDYWDAKLKEQKYMENQGDLWRTEKVLEIFAMTFKEFREATTVFVDKMTNETDLPVRVIEDIKRYADGMLLNAREKLMIMDTGERTPEENKQAALDELGLN